MEPPKTQSVSSLLETSELADDRNLVDQIYECLRHPSDGLVKVVPKSGTYVTPINIDRYLEAAYLRTLVEVGVAGRAAGRWNQEHETKEMLSKPLAKQHEALEQGDYFNFAKSDEEFHFNIFCVAGVPGHKSTNPAHAMREPSRLTQNLRVT